MSTYQIDSIGTRTVIDDKNNVQAHLHTNGNLYVNGGGPLSKEDILWLLQKELSKAFKAGKSSTTDWDPYAKDYLSKMR